MSKLIEKINKEQIRTDIPEFRVGDTVRVGVRIKEGKKERIQNFEGIVFNITGGYIIGFIFSVGLSPAPCGDARFPASAGRWFCLSVTIPVFAATVLASAGRWFCLSVTIPVSVVKVPASVVRWFPAVLQSSS